jgi:CspA family cold shock protein
VIKKNAESKTIHEAYFPQNQQMYFSSFEKGGNMAKYTGTVKWFDQERGYGFISANDGKDVFVHHSCVKEKGTDKDVHEGEAVTFDVVTKEKGPSAINVQKSN